MQLERLLLIEWQRSERQLTLPAPGYFSEILMAISLRCSIEKDQKTLGRDHGLASQRSSSDILASLDAREPEH